jgi:predicted  nucleic acid-binding Zn-ribbon protein
MPEFTAVQLAMVASLFAIGVLLGWFLRSDRCAREKIAINAGWQEQAETRQAENDRLADQNRGLMQQVSEHQASNNDSQKRARDFAASLKDALERRDELQRQLKDVRDKLDAAVEQGAHLQKELGDRNARGVEEVLALKEKDDRISKLSRQLSSWQSRVPPLVEKFRERDRKVQELQAELDSATTRIVALEVLTRPDETQIEPVEQEALDLRLDASNDQYDETSEHELSGLQDQVDRYYAPNHLTGAEHGSDSPLSMHSFEDSALAGEGLFPPATPDGSQHQADGRDDLQQIKGVGPAIEKTLNELGYVRFQQLAEISEYDIDRIAERLRGLRSRIYREDWIGQARALQYAKNRDAT